MHRFDQLIEERNALQRRIRWLGLAQEACCAALAIVIIVAIIAACRTLHVIM